ncbi:MAG: hypothetical protein ABI286_02305 [Edaphobacter sp.]
MLLKSKYIHAFVCMMALLLCVLVARPFVSMGVNDDWSYIWTARVLADTGHVVYNGWATAMLGWQIYLGALFIKLFGFSFTAVRCSVLLVSLLCAALMQRVFVRTGASEGTATIATLSLVLSPLFLPLSFSFMTDIPALFVVVICIYCCLRAYQSASDTGAIVWLVCAASSNVVGGTVRQIAWLGALIMVPSAVWCMRRRRYILPAGMALWILGALSIVGWNHWFQVQPYAAIEKTFYEYHLNSAFVAASIALVSITCLLPVMCAFVVANPIEKRSVRNFAAIAGAIAGSLLFWWAVASPQYYFKSIPLGVRGNYVSVQGENVGAILSVGPDVVPIVVRLLLTAAIVSALTSFAVCLIDLIGRRDSPIAPSASTVSARRLDPSLSNASLMILFAPFVMAYVFLILTRKTVFDRYFLPLQFIFTIGLVRVYRQTISEKLPRFCLLAVLLFAAYGVASMHDLFAFDRARLDAINEVTAAGVPRTAIEGGFEYDGWTQLEQTGYVNEPRILLPPGAYKEWVPPKVPLDCIGYFRKYTPSIHPQLHLSHSLINCYKPSHFAPIIYKTWLLPRQRTIYILENR